jgi:hypothetical protein
MSIVLDPTTGLDQNSITGASSVPAGTTAQRPANPVVGVIRFNSEIGAFEGYNGTGWAPL